MCDKSLIIHLKILLNLTKECKKNNTMFITLVQNKLYYLLVKIKRRNVFSDVFIFYKFIRQSTA